MNYKLGFIGFGNMAYAICLGIVEKKLISPADIAVFDINADRVEIAKSKGFKVFSSAQYCANECEYIILAVKPQNFVDLNVDFSNNVLISIMAGVSIDKLSSLGTNRVARVMPNAPCMKNKGASGLSFSNLTNEQKGFTIDIFSAIGTYIVIDESFLDAVTATSGSGPAYVYYFVKAVMDASEKLGLSKEDAKKLTLATFEGAIEVLKSSEKCISDEINMVCSKGGTTIQAIEHFNNENLANIIFEGMQKCYDRSKELSQL